jgi:YjbE family integral membrane protein
LDLGFAGFMHPAETYIWGLLNIIIINLVLSGDNAVLIAMAIRSLPPATRKKGFIFGAGAAVALRIIFTFVIAEILGIPCLKLAGGMILLWVAAKLFVMGFPRSEEKEAATLYQAIRILLIADLTMSLDNIIAIAGVSQGNFLLLVLGLGLSIPFVIFTSGLLSMLMDRYPVIIYIGAAILGRVGAEMILTDPALTGRLNLPVAVRYGFEAFCALGVIIAGRVALRWVILAEEGAANTTESSGKDEESHGGSNNFQRPGERGP